MTYCKTLAVCDVYSTASSKLSTSENSDVSFFIHSSSATELWREREKERRMTGSKHRYTWAPHIIALSIQPVRLHTTYLLGLLLCVSLSIPRCWLFQGDIVSSKQLLN